jgi:hypothetical protein
MTHKIIKTDNYLLVVDDSLTIGKGYALNTSYKLLLKYNTDQHLFYANDIVKKIIAHLPLNGSPILEGVDLLPPYSRHQEENVDALAEYYWKMMYIMALDESTKPYIIEDFKAGYNKAKEKYKYTEYDIEIAMLQLAKYMIKGVESIADVTLAEKAKSIVQSLHQYPTEFECEMEEHSMDMPNIHHKFYKPKTITTAQGVQWVGKYK